MGLTGYRLRADGRRGLRRWAASVIVLALAGGVALTAATAARRTDTAFARHLDAAHTADAIVNANVFAELFTEPEADAKALLDELDRAGVVMEHGRYGGIAVAREVNGEFDERFLTDSATGYATYDTAAGRTVSTMQITSGRMSDPERADEVVANPEMADRLGYRVGQRITDLQLYEFPDDWSAEDNSPIAGTGTTLSLRVVGIGRPPEDFLAESDDQNPRLYFTPAFTAQFPDAPFYYTELIRLKGGAERLRDLEAALRPLRERAPSLGFQVSSVSEGLAKSNRANDPLVNGLWILAGLAAVVGLLLAGQSVSRVIHNDAPEQAQLRAIGATVRERMASEIGTAALVIAAAALLAVLVGTLLSPLTPVGVARETEPNPGFTLHWGLALGAVALLFVGALAAALPSAWRVARSRALPGPAVVDMPDHRSPVAEAAARAGMSVPAVMGTRFALQPGRGATSTPVRSVLASLVLLITAVTATVAFGANVQRLTDTPRLYGWNWDAATGTSFGTIPDDVDGVLSELPNVAAVAGMTIGDVTIDGRVVPAIGIDSLLGVIAPVVTAGRLPKTDHEVVLGAKTMRLAHLELGSTFDARIQDHAVRLRVVGSATLPAFGAARFTESGLGTGVLGVAALLPQEDPTGSYNYYLLRYDPGHARAGVAKFREFVAAEGCSEPECVLSDLAPAEIDGYRRASGLPAAVGVMLALLLVASLTHVLLSTMARRRVDLAILRAVGLVPRQLASVLRWQAVVLTGVALAVGVPLGLLANQLAWRAFTDQLGIDPGTVLPIALLLLGAAAVLVLALLLATIAGARVSAVARRHQLAL